MSTQWDGQQASELSLLALLVERTSVEPDQFIKLRRSTIVAALERIAELEAALTAALPYVELCFSASVTADIPSVLKRVRARRDEVAEQTRTLLAKEASHD